MVFRTTKYLPGHNKQAFKTWRYLFVTWIDCHKIASVCYTCGDRLFPLQRLRGLFRKVSLHCILDSFLDLSSRKLQNLTLAETCLLSSRPQDGWQCCQNMMCWISVLLLIPSLIGLHWGWKFRNCFLVKLSVVIRDLQLPLVIDVRR